VVFKLNDPVALGADHMVMMLTDVPMLISNNTIVEAVFVGKTIATHEVQGIRNKGRHQGDIFFFYDFIQFILRKVLLCLKKSLQHFHAVFQAVNIFLLKKLLELFFFLKMDRLHHMTLSMGFMYKYQPLGPGIV